MEALTPTLPIQIDPRNLDYTLPTELIAQEPQAKRDQARLMVLHRDSNKIENRVFTDLIDYLNPGDVLVVNKAKVSPARLQGRKTTGGKVEVLLIGPNATMPGTWRALVKPMMKLGTKFVLGTEETVTLLDRNERGENILSFEGNNPEKLMKDHGNLPLPPYIKRKPDDPRIQKDAEEYQTVYASEEGSLAAPTAGLHFSKELLKKIEEKGIKVLTVLLHVGWGTFKPISKDLESHEMYPEKYEIKAETIASLKKARQENRRIVAVGTTVTRVLESLPDDASIEDVQGETNLFIKPGFAFRWISGLVTNFHVPRSTPISLTASFCSLKKLEEAYSQAIQHQYRFFSYGDAMLIL